MRNLHSKNTVRYYLLIVAFLAFLFFSNDFGLINVQKTAIVMAVGVDREEDTFILTSQIAIPQSSKQGKATETVQIVSRGKTIADAFEEINAKTGWYPKLVFCNLIILGEKTAQENVFDALDYFLRDEYLSDNCLVATCDGLAKDLLNVTALVDPSGSVAMQKVLSPHAERVGAVLPSTLRDFAVGYFSESHYGYLPIIKTQAQQEKISGEKENANSSSEEKGDSDKQSSGNGGDNKNNNETSNKQAGDSGNSGGKSSGESGGKSGGESGGAQSKNDKPVFSAGETALFVNGKQVERLTREESFAFGAVINHLKLAKYSVPSGENSCTLTIRNNQAKTKLSIGKNDRAALKIEVTLTAGVADYSKSQDIENISDAGDLPKGVFEAAEKKLTAEITRVFDKCRLSGCDLFGIRERLIKYEKSHAKRLADTILINAIPDVQITFRNIR